MKIGFFSDAHGNLVSALDCLFCMRAMGVENFYFLGDAIGYLPAGLEVLQFLLSEQIPCILGNHEAMVIGELPIPKERDHIYKLTQAKEMIPKSILEILLKSWPISRTLHVSCRHILMIHGRPSNPLYGYLYENDKPYQNELSGYDVIVMGHTHRPFLKQSGDVLLINAGSCGLPRDIGNMASFAIYDSVAHTAEIHRFKINVESLLCYLQSHLVHESVIECLYRNWNNKDTHL